MSGNLLAKTSGGNMNVKIESVSKYVNLPNTGDIKLTLPAGKDFNLKANADEMETSGLDGFRGKMDGKSIDGTLGNGGTVSTERMNFIVLRLQEALLS